MAAVRRSRIITLAVACFLAYIFFPILYLGTSSSPPIPSFRDHYSNAAWKGSHHPPPPSDDQRMMIGDIPYRRSGIDWATVHKHFPVETHTVLPSGPATAFPPVQYAFPAADSAVQKLNERRAATVRNVFRRDWGLYRRFAWTHDELQPVSGTPKNPFCGWAASLVDALDTLWIMGLRKEFDEAVRVVAQLDWAYTPESSLNVFETTIRHLGGLLSAYALSNEPVLLAKAHELGDLLYTAFDTPNHIPPFWLSFETSRRGRQVAGAREASAAMGTLSMEFSELSRLTGNSKYYDAIVRVNDFFQRTQNATALPGMWPLMIDFRAEKVTSTIFTLGGGADSLYEYFPKMDLLLGGRNLAWREMGIKALDTALNHLVFRAMTPDNADVLFSGRAGVDSTGVVTPVYESEHLTCFVGGMYMMAGKLYARPDYLSVGERLANGCAWAYEQFPTGVMPEGFQLMACSAADSPAPEFPPCAYDESKHGRNAKMPAGFVNVGDGRYIMRPEAIESVFYAYRITGREEYRDTAWRMWEAIEKLTRVDYGHSGIADVNVNVKADEEIRYLDSMESFWFAETLKYFYLIFSEPDMISLDEWVLNTEAHPLRRPVPEL
ncbi:hypothetical protein TD95_003857 [Thielaviopsis punctulata]|uniref:alpha-1,2-Mannosidase n=1 Tax=Thielaviopsis punctulata TaxID=72032 RepID=A0A0F4ZHN8_9PEZI|nr:hypothetical protein TD95_003857 [Thielaviopsis punctulata]